MTVWMPSWVEVGYATEMMGCLDDGKRKLSSSTFRGCVVVVVGELMIWKGRLDCRTGTFQLPAATQCYAECQAFEERLVINPNPDVLPRLVEGHPFFLCLHEGTNIPHGVLMLRKNCA